MGGKKIEGRVQSEQVVILNSNGTLFIADIGDGSMDPHERVDSTWEAMIDSKEPIVGKWQGTKRVVSVRFNPDHVVCVSAAQSDIII